MQYNITETNIRLADTDIQMRANAGESVTKWKDTRYRYDIEIMIDGAVSTFNYYGSAFDYLKGKDALSRGDLIDALENIVSDAILGTYNCEEFFDEIGYDDPCEGIKAYKGCVKTLKTLNDMGVCDNTLYEISDALQEMD